MCQIGFTAGSLPADLDKPIFAPAPGGGLMLTASTNTGNHIAVAGVMKFWIVLPPYIHEDKLSLTQTVTEPATTNPAR